jgi:YVTN family beta-propeller protein
MITEEIPAGDPPAVLAVNPITKKINVANTSSNTVNTIDGATGTPPSLMLGLLRVLLPSIVSKLGGRVENIDSHRTVRRASMIPTCKAARSQTLVSASVVLSLSSLFVLTPPADAQTVTQQVPVGVSPQAIAVNPVTNKIYVANTGSSTVTVIDGATGNPTFLGVGEGPVAVAINTATNKIYVADSGGVEVDVINGATNAITPVVVGYSPKSIAVNPVTNKIYVPNAEGNNLTVIDGATNAVSTIATGTTPRAVAVNQVTNQIYVANYSSNNVTVIDGASAATSTVAAGTNPLAITVNPVTNQIYVANSGGSNVTVINGATRTTSTVAVGATPYALAINTVTNKIYVANNQSANVTVIDGASSGTTTVPTGINPGSIAVDAITNQVYVANQSDGNVVAIDGGSNTVTSTVAIGATVTALAVNPVTDKIYAANLGTNSFSTNNVAQIDGATNALTTAPFQTGYGGPVLVNPATNELYFSGSNGLAVLDAATGNVTTINSYIPAELALNPVTNKIYALEGSYTDPLGCGFAVIDGATNASTCMMGSWASLAVDPIQNRIYLYDGRVLSVVDGASNAVVATVDVTGNFSNEAEYGPNLAVNPITNKIYVLSDVVLSVPQDSISYYYSVTVIDGASDTVTANVPIVLPGLLLPTPQAIGVNTVTNKIYVASSTNPGYSQPVVPNETLTVIDGVTNGYYTFPLGPASTYDFPKLAINPNTNTIYVSNGGGSLLGGGSYPGSVEVVNGDSLAVTYVSVPSPGSVAVNPTTNKIYAIAGSGPSPQLAVIDGATNTFTSVTNLPLFGRPSQLAANPVTNQLYASDNGSGLLVLTEQQTVASPLNTTVTPLPGNVTSNPSPTFDFTATSTFAPIAPPVQKVYYQLDTTTGPWTPATGTAPNFTGRLSNIPLGNHILYFYATDGSDSTELGLGETNTGAVSAYSFTIVNL